MQYLHPDNKHLPFVDWRAKEHRLEGFLRWFKWRLRYGDIDHFTSNNAYANATGIYSPTGKPMTKEQRCWFSLLFGMTYQSDMAWVLYWHFPNFWDINLEEMQKWNVATLERQRYARDAKYNKGRITQQTADLQKKIGPTGSIEKFFHQFIDNDESASFNRVYDAVNSFYKYGRMTTWLACQVLQETAGLPIKPDNVLVDHPANWSVRQGLTLVYGRDEMGYQTSFSEDDVKWMKDREKELLEKSKAVIDEDKMPFFTNFVFETNLCQYKSVLMDDDYPGHTASDHMSRAVWLRDRWPEVRFEPYFNDVIPQYHPLVRNKMLSRELDTLCYRTGQLINMHMDFEDMPNMYSELNINPDWFFEHKTYEPIVREKIDKYVAKVFNKAWW